MEGLNFTVSSISQMIEIKKANEAYNMNKVNNLKPSGPLNILEYKFERQVGKTSVELRIRTIDHQPFAFKLIPNIDPFSIHTAEAQKKYIFQEDLPLQIEILKKLKSSPNIVKFVGYAVEATGTQYLVTEWLEYGSLREFYTNHAAQMTREKKLEFAMDIARGLNFLTTVGILHHDIRSETIFVGKHKEAKIGNFE